MNDSKGGMLAVEHCSAGIASTIEMRADAMQHIDASIAADGSYALPKVAKAWMLHSARDSTSASEVSVLLKEIEQHLPSRNCLETRLYDALKLTRAGKGIECATKLEELLLHSPTDLFVHQLFHEEAFWLGKADWMRDITEKAASAWSESSEGYEHFLAIRAFANEEAGYLDAAERYGRMAVEIDSAHIWGTHAVAHVKLMKGEYQSGADWMESLCANWGHSHQMRHHLWWHVCLFLFELGQHDRILELLDTEIRNPNSSLVMASPAAPIDVQNYSSLLLRLELYGVDVTNQWNTLASVCAKRVNNHGNALGNTHDMMVLAATNQFDKANELLDSMIDLYHLQQGSVALSYNAVGIPACKAILAHRMKDFESVLDLLGAVRYDLPLVGGSHAQRDVFYHLLVHAAKKLGKEKLRAVYIKDIERIGFCAVPDRIAYRN